MERIMPIIQVGNVLLSADIIDCFFYCNLEVCHGACCVEGDAGAPVTHEEITQLKEDLSRVEHLLSHKARRLLEHQGVAYADPEGELVTNIVDGRDCAFACRGDDGCTLCALERVGCHKPISCSLYPIREKTIGGFVCLNYHRWDICSTARRKGQELKMPVYRFLKEPLIRRFGEQWYAELEQVAQALTKN